jgi:hypothetical protein
MFAVIVRFCVIVERMICCGTCTCIAPGPDTQVVVPCARTEFGEDVRGVIDVLTNAGVIPETDEGGVGVRICCVPFAPCRVFKVAVTRGKYVTGDFETVIVERPGIDGFKMVCGMICV